MLSSGKQPQENLYSYYPNTRSYVMRPFIVLTDDMGIHPYIEYPESRGVKRSRSKKSSRSGSGSRSRKSSKKVYRSRK